MFTTFTLKQLPRHCTDAVGGCKRCANSCGRFDVDRDHSIDERRTVFVQNAETHTHGFNSADLTLGPYRNAEIINSILKAQYFELENKTGFQRFGK